MKPGGNSLLTIAFICLLGVSSASADTITKPNTFSAGNPAVAADVNANFDTVYDQVNKMGSEITIDDVNGRVGIGTASPSEKLDVTGNIKASGTICDGNGCLGSGSGLMSVQAFNTSGVHTWNKPAGVSRIRVIATGGGGGGGSHNGDDATGGGGAGGTAIEIIDVDSVSSVSLTVGAGGTGSCGNISNGGTIGGTSLFDSYLSATGGSPPPTWGIGGLGGVGSGGDLNLKGGDGGGGNIDGSNNSEVGGTGGSSFWGGGGSGGTAWATRRNGSQGSGGGGTHVNTNNCGGDGGAGMVVVYEYGSTGSAGIWQDNGSDVYFNAGNVAIGTTISKSKLSVVGLPSGSTSAVVGGDSSGVAGAVCITNEGNMYIDTDGSCSD